VPRGSLPVITFSPDGRLLCTRGNDIRSTCLWDTADGRLRGRPEGCCPEFARDGKHLVTCVPGGVKVWDCATGRETAALQGPRYSGAYALLSPDGGLVLASTTVPLRFEADGSLKTDDTQGGPSGTLPLDVRLWDAGTGAERARFGGRPGATITPGSHRTAGPWFTPVLSLAGRGARSWCSGTWRSAGNGLCSGPRKGCPPAPSRRTGGPCSRRTPRAETSRSGTRRPENGCLTCPARTGWPTPSSLPTGRCSPVLGRKQALIK
jgi:WD40 repeat protein